MLSISQEVLWWGWLGACLVPYIVLDLRKYLLMLRNFSSKSSDDVYSAYTVDLVDWYALVQYVCFVVEVKKVQQSSNYDDWGFGHLFGLLDDGERCG